MSAKRDIPGPVRTCVGCGRRDSQGAMLRLERRDGGDLVLGGRVRRGRGAWVHPVRACVDGIGRSKSLGRSLRTMVTKEARQQAIEWLRSRVAASGPAPEAENVGLR